MTRARFTAFTEEPRTYGLLEILDEAVRTRTDKRRVRVRCSCEKRTVKLVQLGNLRAGHTTSCGCVRAERVRAATTKHGHAATRSREYEAYYSMLARCYDPSCDSYAWYGGKGVTVCPPWRASFEAFLADIGARPAGHVLSRKDHKEGFTPTNAVWSTRHDADRRKSNTRMFEINGRELCLEDWAAEHGIAKSTLHYRLAKGLTMREALDLGHGRRGKVIT